MEADVTVQFTLKFRSHSSVECGEKNHIQRIRKHLFSFVWNKAQFKCHAWRAKLSHWADFLCGASQGDAVYSEYAAKSLIKLNLWSNFCFSWWEWPGNFNWIRTVRALEYHRMRSFSGPGKQSLMQLFVQDSSFLWVVLKMPKCKVCRILPEMKSQLQVGEMRRNVEHLSPHLSLLSTYPVSICRNLPNMTSVNQLMKRITTLSMLCFYTTTLKMTLSQVSPLFKSIVTFSYNSVVKFKGFDMVKSLLLLSFFGLKPN